jgi:anti-sigma regulatory factor (Ser/Thr protein kinase)
MQDVTLTLPMLPDMELTASKTACAMGEHIQMSQDKIDEVQMAVVEATINAFEHSGSPDRKVSIHFEVYGSDDEAEGLQITVCDAGVGIPSVKLASPDGEDTRRSLPQKRGHGLRIINGLMDEVDIRSDSRGTTVIMRKMR